LRRKTFCALIISIMIVCACATIPKTPLSPMDVSVLKGKWEGERDMIWGRYRSYDHTILEIYNDSIPLRGRIDIAFMEGTDPRVYIFKNGVIDPNGNLSVQLEKEVSSFLLSLYREKRGLKLDGYYRHRSNEGRLTLYKK
jgi:hypothetical protein